MTTWLDSGPNAYVPAAIGGSGNLPTVATNSINGLTSAANTGSHFGLQIPSSPGVSLTSKDTWSAFFVVKHGAVNSEAFSLAGSTSVGFRMTAGNTRLLQLIYSNVENISGEPALALNTWYSIVFVVNNSVMTAYINGSPAYSFGTHSMASTTFPTIFDLCQGATTDLNGNLAEVALYDRALNSTEITSLANYASATYGLTFSTAAPMTTSVPPYFWFQPAGLTGSNGSEIASWVDSGLWGITANASGAAGNRPTYATNSLNGFTTVACANKPGLVAANSSNDPAGIYLASKDTWSVFAIVNFSALGSSENDFGCLGGGGADGARFGLDSTGKFVITIPNVGNFTNASLSPALNTWHTIVIVDNAQALTVYCDGTSYSFGTHSVFSLPTAMGNLMGNNSSGYFFQGNLAEYAAYNGALTSTDAANLKTYAHTTYGF